VRIDRNLRVCICSTAANAALSDDVGHWLRRGQWIAIEPTPCGFAAAADPVDMLVQLVDQAGLADALAQLSALRSRDPSCVALVVAIDLGADQIRALLARGASDFVKSPVAADELLVRAQRLLGLSAPQGPAPIEPPAIPGLIGTSPAFVRQLALVPTLARHDVGVLLLGETGTGKEVFAQAVHYLSPRAGQPLVAVNCGAIPAELVEDELFGHVRGAYTHAHSARPGLIREAEGGTLFLDEIDALPGGAQVKLLRFLQDKQYRPVGSSSVARADVRVFAASNGPLADLVDQGSFRRDLFFRLNLMTLRLPPLRERIEDIVPLAEHFLRLAAREWHRPVASLSRAAIDRLLSYAWPGNVRELKNVIERAALLCSGPMVGAEHVDLDVDRDAPDSATSESFRAAKGRVLESFERAYIERLLAASCGNVTRAAQAAQKNRRAFFELMRKYRIEPDRFRPDPGRR
jgi:two-component system, NtrC family, response regulator GlrR